MPVPAAAAFHTIGELGAGLRAGEYTSVELTEFFLDRCEKLGPGLNAVVTLMRDRALPLARQADAERKSGRDRGPLHGIPCGIKDLLATKGYPTSWGAAPFRDQRIEADATVVRKLDEAGAVIVAKLSMVEIAGGMGYEQANASFTGPGLNPWNPGRWSGGSSSGPGSAVGGGLVPYAIGSETWGSIMTPACLCGITGLRPTYGRVSRHGAMALSWTMDKLGPMARTAEDCGLVLNAIAGRDSADDSSLDRPYRFPDPDAELPEKVRLATLRGAVDRVQPEIAANFAASVEVLKDFATFEEVALPDDMPWNAVADVILSAEAAAAFEDLISSGRIEEMTAPEDRWKLWSDLMIPATDYIQALRVRRKLQWQLDTLMLPFHALVSPTLSTVAGPIDVRFGEWSRGFSSTQIGGASNAAGIPGITIPNGFGADGLPTGLQLTGRAFDENLLLAIAQEYQRRTDWHRRHPD